MSPRNPVSPEKRKRSSKKEIHIFFKKMHHQRLALKMDQATLADALGMTRGNVSRMEAGVFPSDPAKIVAIADALNVSLDWLFGRE